MKIKSLLLGSAAALAAVSGAQAADAIVAAAPEPMEYVRVCDAFGTGYFYIPGTETCLKVGGTVRYQVNWGGAANTWSHYSRFRLEVSAKNDSDYGTVYSWLRIQGANTDNAAASYDANYYAGIQGDMIGFEFGRHDDFWTRFFGYGIITDAGGDYGYRANQYLALTANFGAASAYLAADWDGGANFMPDVSAGVKASFGDYSAGLGVGYDSSLASYAVKGVVRGSISPVNFGIMGLYANNAANAYWAHNGWSVIVGVGAAVTESVSVGAHYQYFSDATAWNITGDVAWAVTDGFAVLVEGSYSQGGTKSAFLRLERSF